MADKKVDRYRPDLTINPSQQTTSALSEKGTINIADAAHDKGRSSLLDKFRRREERWRQEQSLHDREVASATPPHGQRHVDEAASTMPVATPEPAEEELARGDAQ